MPSPVIIFNGFPNIMHPVIIAFGILFGHANCDLSLFVDIPGPFFYIAVPDLQLPMYLRGPNQIVIITGIHPLTLILRELFLRLKTLNNDYKHNSIVFICQVCDNKIFLI